MTRKLNAGIALLIGLGLASAAIAQGRHDERPHGYNKAKADAAATAKVEQPSATGGRHDEKPHGVTKTAAAPKAKSTGKSAATPAAEASDPKTAK